MSSNLGSRSKCHSMITRGQSKQYTKELKPESKNENFKKERQP